MTKSIINTTLAQYLKGQIEQGDGAAKKRALQQLCQLLRKGQKIHPHLLESIEICVVGVLWTQGADTKIRRWALNAIAQFGREKNCKDAVVHALQHYGDDPETAASAVAALFHLSADATKAVKNSNVLNEDVIVLAALQQVDISKIELDTPCIDIEKAAPEILKLALIVVGMDKAPQNLFHPNHSNADIVKVLGKHDDAIVSQYSVWAITENDTLGMRDLGIEVKDIEFQAANIRSWVYQLVAIEAKGKTPDIELIRLGSMDKEAEVRRGLTVGLKETYFDGIDTLVSDWFFSEDDVEVRNGLIDHIVKQAGKNVGYTRLAIELYDEEVPNSKLRTRMEAVASGATLYGQFKQISLNTPSLFGPGVGSNNVTNYNIRNMIGVNSIGGNASNSGSFNAISESERVSIMEGEFEKIGDILGDAPIPEGLKSEIAKAIVEAKKTPSKDAVGKVVEGLKTAKSLTESVAGVAKAGIALAPIILTLGHLFGLA